MLQVIDPTNQLVWPEKADAQIKRIDRAMRQHSPYTYLAKDVVPNYSHTVETTAKNQTMVNEALIACALERYRLVHGDYPEALDTLMPQFLEKIPHDLIGGGPLKYRKEGDKFVLYSIGWNGKDDGGVPSPDGNLGLTKNDWVWPFQEPIKK